MNVNPYNTTDYENKSNWTLGQNKPNSKPIKANCRKGKIDAKYVLTKDYKKNDDFTVRINEPNFRTPKMNANAFSQKDYKNEPPSGSKKTNPNKPNFFKGQNEQKITCRKIWPQPPSMLAF